jgi:hypothetical protein
MYVYIGNILNVFCIPVCSMFQAIPPMTSMSPRLGGPREAIIGGVHAKEPASTSQAVRLFVGGFNKDGWCICLHKIM